MPRLFPYFLQQFWRPFSTWYQLRAAVTFTILLPIAPALQRQLFSSTYLFRAESGKNTLNLPKKPT